MIHAPAVFANGGGFRLRIPSSVRGPDDDPRIRYEQTAPAVKTLPANQRVLKVRFGRERYVRTKVASRNRTDPR